MRQLFRWLRPQVRHLVDHAGLVLLASCVVAGMGVHWASRLRIDADLAALLPPEHPTVVALERLRATVGGESDAAVAIESPSFAANRAFAEALIPRALALRGATGEPHFQRVDYRRDTAFLRRNLLYFATDEQLDQVEAFLRELRAEARLRASPLYLPLEEEGSAAPDTAAQRLRELRAALDFSEYPISADSTVLVLRFYPSMAQTDIGRIEAAYADLQALVDELGPATYHAAMRVVLAGRLQRQLVEVQAITHDVFRSFGSGVAAVLLVVVVYFAYKAYRVRAGRSIDGPQLLRVAAQVPLLALLIGLPFLISLAVTFGIAYLVYGTLNLMTSTLGLVLFGLGIDYGIHFYARYTEERARGRDCLQAVEETFLSTGQAIAVGALTTAGALYVLMAGAFRGFSQFGFIAGTGILLALVGMVVVMPALVALFERVGWLRLESRGGTPGAVAAGATRAVPWVPQLLVGLGAVAAAVVLIPRVEFEYDFGRLEPSYAEYRERRELVRRVYPAVVQRNPAYLLVDGPEAAEELVAAIRARAAADTLSPTIGAIETLQDRFPMTPGQQQEKLAHLARLRALLEDPLLAAAGGDELEVLRQAAQTQAPISLEQVPQFLQQPFLSRDGRVGHFLRVYPSVGLADGRNSIAFLHDIGVVEVADGTRYHAASTALVGGAMLELMVAEAPWMVLLTWIMVGVLMWLNFGSGRWTALALLPLLVGVMWMLLAMVVGGLKLNFYNMIVLPAVLGIGNDAGAHLVHRYREEGPGSIGRVLRSTGEHVTMGSLTTVIGFMGLLLSFHPGLRSIGVLAIVGIGATWLAAVLFLPAVLAALEQRGAPGRWRH